MKATMNAAKKFRVAHPDLRMQYDEGKDSTWKPGTNSIGLTPNSRIPFKTPAQRKPPKDGSNMFAAVLHSEGPFFHDLQVQVSSWHKTDLWPEPYKQQSAHGLSNQRVHSQVHQG
jgi:hypothetical protein